MTREQQIAETQRMAAQARAARRTDPVSPRQAVVLRRRDWPWAVRTVALFRAAGDRGVGDTVARELKRFSFDSLAHAYEAITGQSCGCADRQAALNRLYPYDAAV